MLFLLEEGQNSLFGCTDTLIGDPVDQIRYAYFLGPLLYLRSKK
jgi:hypothetical protein